MGGKPPGPPPPGPVHNIRGEIPVKSLVYAQSETVALHRPYLYRYALSKLRRTDTADEVVQAFIEDDLPAQKALVAAGRA